MLLVCLIPGSVAANENIPLYSVHMTSSGKCVLIIGKSYIKGLQGLPFLFYWE